ncbi:hypothetical protein BJ508DRAFT_308069 [Ascobolus immersus RN42]|uniref:Uncharacterized protein n=1 Tax=Ascobolus immersus RN42 TaxID=1160509 RepID=A0A3N4I6G8_ASCIM|nr:hypothetical protein BJ508DRAFT_308069 [Ascobolus immersus RN42]
MASIKTVSRDVITPAKRGEEEERNDGEVASRSFGFGCVGSLKTQSHPSRERVNALPSSPKRRDPGHFGIPNSLPNTTGPYELPDRTSLPFHSPRFQHYRKGTSLVSDPRRIQGSKPDVPSSDTSTLEASNGSPSWKHAHQTAAEVPAISWKHAHQMEVPAASWKHVHQMEVMITVASWKHARQMEVPAASWKHAHQMEVMITVASWKRQNQSSGDGVGSSFF